MESQGLVIKKINKLKSFGIFHDYSWEQDLKEFSRFNLIYGWNRSGKTTFSRLFESCEKRCTYDGIKFKQYPDNGEFEILTVDDCLINSSNVAHCNMAIKVFNQDFIDENISFNPSDTCNPIVYISEVDIEKKTELKRLKLSTEGLSASLTQAELLTKEKNKQKDTFLTGLGREISGILFDKTYNRTRVENKIRFIGVDNFSDKILDDTDRIKFENISKSKADDRKTLPEISEYKFTFNVADEAIDDYPKLYTVTRTLLDKKVLSETLDRLKSDASLNNWVQHGYNLHKLKSEQEKCLFCQNRLDDGFLTSLSKHFSTDYEQLQNSISSIKKILLSLKQELFPSTNDNLYPDLKANYILKIEELNTLIVEINLWIDSLIEKLDEKYNNPLAIIAINHTPQEFLTKYNQLIKKINKILSQHNSKLKDHSKEVSNAKEKLEVHCIAVALVAQDYNKLEVEVKEANDIENKARATLTENKSKVTELEKQTSNIGTAIHKINNHLKEFFGRAEIKLELSSDGKGYIIQRDGMPARNLSEGEKTAIAFSYFVVKTEENQFKIKDIIIFIDDPISSFDSNSIHHCFSMIKNHFKDAKQLFISTHNFQFFNLVKKWLRKKNEDIERSNKEITGNKQKKIPCNFYMIRSVIKQEQRIAKLLKLDETLEKYRSEYNYLFSILNRFTSKEDYGYDDLYTISNVARRFFDVFADFKIPAPDSYTPWDKLLKIVKEINKGKVVDQVSTDEQEKLFGLINGYSHNDDPLSAVEHIDRTECVNAINILLKIIQSSDPIHYSHLTNNNIISEINPNPSLALSAQNN